MGIVGGEMSGWGNFLGDKWPGGNCPGENCPWGEVDRGEIYLEPAT